MHKMANAFELSRWVVLKKVTQICEASTVHFCPVFMELAVIESKVEEFVALEYG